MRISQLHGPLKSNVQYTCDVPTGRYLYTCIGIQTPQTPPLTEVDLDDMTTFLIGLDNKEFRINANDILEFHNLGYTSNITITPLQDVDEYTIIDIAYTAITE